MSDPYSDFAERYDLFAPSFGTHDPVVVAFYRQLFAEHEIHSVLDCACGTGADLKLFHELGLEAVGSDISAAMLAQARQNLAAVGLMLGLHQVDYRELPAHFQRTFDAVTCLSSSLLHMPDEREALRALRSMRDVLRPGGLLIITQGTTDRQWREKPRFILAVDNAELTRLFVLDYDDTGARYNILDIEHGPGGGQLHSWAFDYPHVLLQADYVRLLAQAGFAPVSFYGNYQREAYNPPSSRRLIVVAERPPLP